MLCGKERHCVSVGVFFWLLYIIFVDFDRFVELPSSREVRVQRLMVRVKREIESR